MRTSDETRDSQEICKRKTDPRHNNRSLCRLVAPATVRRGQTCSVPPYTGSLDFIATSCQEPHCHVTVVAVRSSKPGIAAPVPVESGIGPAAQAHESAGDRRAPGARGHAPAAMGIVSPSPGRPAGRTRLGFGGSARCRECEHRGRMIHWQPVASESPAATMGLCWSWTVLPWYSTRYWKFVGWRGRPGPGAGLEPLDPAAESC